MTGRRWKSWRPYSNFCLKLWNATSQTSPGGFRREFSLSDEGVFCEKSAMRCDTAHNTKTCSPGLRLALLGRASVIDGRITF